MWEANRLWEPGTTDPKYSRYMDARIEQYGEIVRKRHALSADQFDTIMDEGQIDGWVIPSYPSCDVAEVALGMRHDVYAIRGGLEYHRKDCHRLEDASRVVTISIHKAVTTKGSKACPLCDP